MQTYLRFCVSTLAIALIPCTFLCEQPYYNNNYQILNDPLPYNWNDTNTRACPCPTAGQPTNGGRAFIACNVQSNSVVTDQLTVHGSACFQGPVQFCSSIAGLPIPPLEGLWFIGTPGQVPADGFSNLDMVRTRSFNCTGEIINILFNKKTKDPADAFTLLKTIRACDVLRFTQIESGDPCTVVRSVETQAATGVTGGCGDFFTIPVFNASGLTELYSATGDCVSLLNFGKPSTATGTTGSTGSLCLCWTFTSCLDASPCAPGATALIMIPTGCQGDFIDGTVLFTVGDPSLFKAFVSNLTKDSTDATSKLSSIQAGDLIRFTEQNTGCIPNYRDLRVVSSNAVVGINTSGAAFCVSIEQQAGNLTNCVCLECFGPVASLQNCWIPVLCTGLSLNQAPPIPTGCNNLQQPGTVLVNNFNYTAVQVVAFSPTSANLSNTLPVFEAIRLGDCIKLYDPNAPSDPFGLYQVTGMIENNGFIVLSLDEQASLSGTMAPLVCLRTYGPCCQ